MEYAINDREPTVTKIKKLLVDLQEKINNYKIARADRYNLDLNTAAIENDPSNNVMTYGNNGTVTCNQYCHGNYGGSWNDELPSDWLGAQCLYSYEPATNTQFGCNVLYTPQPPPAPPPNNPPATQQAATQQAAPQNQPVVVPTLSTLGSLPTTQREGFGVNSGSDESSIQCMCQRNDSFPFSTSGYGDQRVPSSLYRFSNGQSNVNHGSAVRCSRDDSSTSISIACLNDLYATLGSTIPIPLPAMPNGLVSIPGTAFTFNIAGGQVDISTIPGMNLGVLKSVMATIAPQTAANMYDDAENPLDAMRDDIMENIKTLNELIRGAIPLAAANKTSSDSTVLKFLNEFHEMNAEFDELNEELKKPSLLDGNYEITRIKTDSIFSRYMLISFFTIFLIVSLIFIFKNPTVGNLDMFVLGLGIIILIYYIYDYIQMKRRRGEKIFKLR